MDVDSDVFRWLGVDSDAFGSDFVRNNTHLPDFVRMDSRIEKTAEQKSSQPAYSVLMLTI